MPFYRKMQCYINGSLIQTQTASAAHICVGDYLRGNGIRLYGSAGEGVLQRKEL